MNNNSFWNSYKAKCAEKGLPPHCESEEEFSKAMTQPSKPYSTDDLAPKIDTHIDFKKGSQMWNEIVDADDIDENKEEKDMAQKVEWLRCIECNEMKEDTDFARLPNGKHRAICKKCMGDKIKNGHKKREERIDIVKEIVDKGTICIPDGKPLEPVNPSCYPADAVALTLSVDIPLLKESKPLMAMSKDAFEAAILFAYEKGKEDAEALGAEEITSMRAENIAAEILKLKTGARA